MRKILFSALYLLSTSVFAHEINLAGTYQCTSDVHSLPNGLNSIMTIQKTGDTYRITETSPNNPEHNIVSIGLVQKHVLAVAYQNKLKNRVGVEVFKIKDKGKKLDGYWAQLGTNSKGPEICVKQK